MKRVGRWFVYFLRCGDGTLYAGITTDLQARLSAHRAGKGAAYTRSRPPLKLVYRETAAGRSEALRREAALRRLSRREKLSLIRSAGGGAERKRRARSRAWALLLLGASSLASRAVAEEPQFTRLIQTSRITGGSLSAAYAGEIQGALGAAPAPGGSGGWAAPGLTHWFYAYYGAAPWLTLGFQQTLRQPTLSTIHTGVSVPEVRFKAGGLLQLPFELSAFVAPRLRTNGRRGTSWVTGLGADKRWSRVDLMLNLGVEQSLGPDHQWGGRYEAGASDWVFGPLSLDLEAWGVLLWTDRAPFEQDHHLGPALKLWLGRWSIAASLALGVRQLSGTYFESSAMVQLGFIL